MHHLPFLAWDLNGDGRTEVAFHSFPADYPSDRYDTAVEEERYTVVDGETGDEIYHVPWPATRSRVMMTVGHLDGIDEPPSVVVQDETYGDVVLTALDGRDGHPRWRVEQARGAGPTLDVAAIAEVLIEAHRLGLDIGAPYNLSRYDRWRRFDSMLMLSLTDSINRLFSNCHIFYSINN